MTDPVAPNEPSSTDAADAEGAVDRPHLRLLGTEACTLCEEAARLVAPVAGAFGWPVERVDVALDDALFERYGLRVPVLVRSDTGEELDWPFDDRAVLALASAPRSA